MTRLRRPVFRLMVSFHSPEGPRCTPVSALRGSQPRGGIAKEPQALELHVAPVRGPFVVRFEHDAADQVRLARSFGKCPRLRCAA